MAKTKKTTPKEKKVTKQGKAIIAPTVPDKSLEDTLKNIPEVLKEDVNNNGIVPGKVKLSVTFNNETFVVETNDIAKAISDLKPSNIKTQVHIKAEYNGKTADRLYFIVGAKQLFRNDTMAIILAKQLNIMLNV